MYYSIIHFLYGNSFAYNGIVFMQPLRTALLVIWFVISNDIHLNNNNTINKNQQQEFRPLLNNSEYYNFTYLFDLALLVVLGVVDNKNYLAKHHSCKDLPLYSPFTLAILFPHAPYHVY